MVQQASPPEVPYAAERSAEHAQYYQRVLHELIDMGADLARIVHKQVVAQDEAAPPGEEVVPSDAIVAYDRITRTIRRTVLLAKRLEEAGPAGPVRTVARRRIIRAVEDVIQREAEGDDAERLESEFRERLDAPELEDEIGARPVDEIIDDICRDLGLTAPRHAHPWKRRTPQDVAALFHRAATSAPRLLSGQPPMRADPFQTGRGKRVFSLSPCGL